jgi:hypothetical protein
MSNLKYIKKNIELKGKNEKKNSNSQKNSKHKKKNKGNQFSTNSMMMYEIFKNN